jgi:4-amino-4-deoxy-L-arabinose transferase-like glycosyltransferase
MVTSSLARRIINHQVAIALVAVAIFVGLSLPPLLEESPTYDEPCHLAAGYSHLARADFRLAADHPPLATSIVALPLLFMDVRWPTDETLWHRADDVRFAYALFYQSGNDPDRLLIGARLVALAWGIAIVVAVFAGARAIFGRAGGFVAVTLATFSPTLLAHGHLVTTDAAVTALALFTLYAFAALAARPTVWRAVGSGALLGAALATKFSALFLIPSIAGAAALRAALQRRDAGPRRGDGPAGRDPMPCAERPNASVARADRDVPWTSRARRCGRGLALALSAALAAYVTIWGAYGFRAHPAEDPTLGFEWDTVRSDAGWVNMAVRTLHDHRVLPESWTYGFALQQQRTRDRASYALGRFSLDGWWWYFPFALLVKTPVGALVLYVWGLCALARAGRTALARAAFLLVPLGVYWAAVVSTPLNIGIRHLAPALALMTVLAGGAAAHAVRSPSRGPCRFLGLLLAAVVIEVVLAGPHYIGFFNAPARLAFPRHHMLVDSNLDWGQDLRRLKRFMDERGIASVKLSYFGSASPTALGLRHEVLSTANVYIMCETGLVGATPFQPGDWVAISATNLVGASFPAEHRDTFARFRSLTPTATVGHSIFVYHLPPRGP